MPTKRKPYNTYPEAFKLEALQEIRDRFIFRKHIVSQAYEKFGSGNNIR